MSGYFRQFPTIFYPFQDNADLQAISGKTQVTYTLARVKFLDAIKTNLAVYYEYDVKEGETPELISDKYYGDAELHWTIILANDIINPYFDWPMDSAVFERYLIAKYGSVALSQTTVHHYDKVITRTESATGIITVSRCYLDAVTYAATPVLTVNSYNLNDGTTVHEDVTTEIIYAFDYEVDANDARRRIKLIKKDHIGTVVRTFESLMGAVDMTVS